MLDYFLAERGRLRATGLTLFSVGAGWVVVGLIARVASEGANAAARLGHLPEKMLAGLYPSWPTWWIPESVAGALPACLLIVGGIWAAVRGKELDDMYW